MVRETWHDIYALYNTYLNHLLPIVAQTRRIVAELAAEDLAIEEVFQIIVDEESKRATKSVKVQEEFSAFFRAEVFETIKKFIREEGAEADDIVDVKEAILEDLSEIQATIEFLVKMAPIDEQRAEQSKLHAFVTYLQGLLFPFEPRIRDIIDDLRENVADWYECQRFLLKPQTYYKERGGLGVVQGVSPILYKVMNNITSLFNLDPNFGPNPATPEEEIPMVKIEEVFEPFLDSLANKYEETIQKIVDQFDFQVVYELFIAPKPSFLEIMQEYNYIVPRESNGTTRWVPQFSNETLFIMYLAKTSFKRGFLSRELVNWISLNLTYIIYRGVCMAFMKKNNIFYPVLLDNKTLEKTIPYLMKLACFKEFLRVDRNKIRDSPQYRKEIYNFLGSQIPCIERLAETIKDQIAESEK